jgi:alkyl hydroperoxide reductase subunit AhpC
VAQLRHYNNDIDALGVQVLIISFGAEFWARAWQQDTGSPYPLLLDPERTTYQAYGLGTSFVRVWSPHVMWHYLKLRLRGQKLLPVQGDPHQLGGDFIVDAAGIIRLSHPSKDPVDRPPVEDLLVELRGLAREETP